jgi:membrane associated rhomboid family serine protease
VARTSGKSFEEAVGYSALVVGFMFLVNFLELLMPGLKMFGIIPRTLWGLVGVVLAPLLHASPAHMMTNALPLLVLLTLLFWDKHYYPGRTLCLIWLASGLGTWVIGRSGAIHIGASSIVYGLVSYLIVSGFLMRSWRSAFVALLVLGFYGGIFYGVLPQRGLVSWEGHLSGAIAGIWSAFRNHEKG